MQGMGSGQGFWTLLSQDDQKALELLGIRRDYLPGATLVLEDDPNTHVFILLNGWVKVFSATKDGQQIMLALRGDGDLVGETAGETTGRRNATIQAIDAVRALIVRYDRFGKFLEGNPGASRAYRRVVTRRWNDSDNMLRRRAVTTGAQRLAGQLLDLADQYGREIDGALYLEMPLSQEELASLVGTSRATITRAYSNWRSRGLIRTGQRRITILDLKGLQQVAGHSR
jgi:CRP/FNR family cyclic AMP-dependent transcriptional regulator